MAEIVGIVAAALEFGRVVRELKELCSSTKHAPEGLGQLLEELDSLDEVLQTLAEQEAVASAYASPNVARNCRQRCEKDVQSIKVICDELSKSIKRSRLRGSLKAALKKDVLERSGREIERAKSNLILAQMATLNAMNTFSLQHHATTRTLIVSSTDHVSALLEDIRQAPQPAHWTTLSNPARQNEQALDPTPQSEAARRSQCAHVRTRRLMLLQSRRLGKAIEFVQQQAYGAWTYGFRTYNVRPPSAPAFVYAEQGNIPALQQLFQTHQASIYDRDYAGLTLLHWASMVPSVPIVRFLIQQGADPKEKAFENEPCAVFLAYADNAANIVDATRVLLQCDVLDDSEDWLSALRWIISCKPQVAPHILETLSPPWGSYDFHIRLQTAYNVCSATAHSTAFWHSLSQPQLESSCLVIGLSRGGKSVVYRSLVSRLARVMAHFWKPCGPCPDLAGWRSLFQSAVRLGGLRASFQHGCPSPMLTYLGFLDQDILLFSGTHSDLSSKRLSQKLRHWAQEVLDAGQDLREYGRWEHELFFSRARLAHMVHDPSSIYLLNFAYGASPSNWQIWASTSLDEHAGDFWKNLEDPEPEFHLPGAWPASRPDAGTSHYSSPDTMRFWRSRRKRRRGLRYLDLPGSQADEIFGDCRSVTAASWVGRQKEAKASREAFFRENGITPPHWCGGFRVRI